MTEMQSTETDGSSTAHQHPQQQQQQEPNQHDFYPTGEVVGVFGGTRLELDTATAAMAHHEEVVAASDARHHDEVTFTATTSTRQRPCLIAFLVICILVMIAMPFFLEHLIVDSLSSVDVIMLLMTFLPTVGFAIYYVVRIKPRFDVYNQNARRGTQVQYEGEPGNEGSNGGDTVVYDDDGDSTSKAATTEGLDNNAVHAASDVASDEPPAAFSSPSRDAMYSDVAEPPHILQFPEVFIRYGMGWICLPMAAGVGLFCFILISVPLGRFLQFLVDPKTAKTVLGTMFYPGFVLAEEVMKFVYMNGMNKHQSLPHYSLYPLYGTAVALGCATAEIYYDVAVVRLISDFTHYYNDGKGTMTNPDAGMPLVDANNKTVTLPPGVGDHESNVQDIFLWSLMGIFIFVPAHILCSYHVGLALSRFQILKHRIYPQVTVVIAAVTRTVFMLIVRVKKFNLFLSLSLCLVFLVVYAAYVKRYEVTHMPKEYLRQAGYMTFFGYGRLPEVDEDDDDTDTHTDTANEQQ